MSKLERDWKQKEEKALSSILGGGSPNKNKQSIVEPDVDLESLADSIELEEIELPWETIYMIDKVVR